MRTGWRIYRRDCLLGALGAALMLVGDLCLSLIPAAAGDSGLFEREAYLSGAFPTWRLPLLLATGLLGMALCTFAVRAVYAQVDARYLGTQRLILVGGALYLVSAGALHYIIGSLADWTSTLAPLFGREEAAALVQARYARLAPALAIPYAGMLALILGNAWAVLSGRSFLPRKMFGFHMVVWQLVFALIPDIRHALGAEPSTWDFVLSQCSGNAALLIWMLSNAAWARRTLGKAGRN